MTQSTAVGPGEIFAPSTAKAFALASGASFAAGDLVAMRPSTDGRFLTITTPVTSDLRDGYFAVCDQAIASGSRGLVWLRGANVSMFCKSSSGTSIASVLSPYTGRATKDGDLDDPTTNIPRKIIARDLAGSASVALSATRAKRDVMFNGIEGLGWNLGTSSGNPFMRMLDVNTVVSAAIASTAVQTNFDKTIALPAALFDAAKNTVRFTISGQFSDTGTPTLTITLRFGATDICVVPSAALGSGVSNVQFRAVIDVTCVTPSATVGVLAANLVSANFGTASVGSVITTTSTFDTTAAYTAAVSATWSAASASNTATLEHFMAEIVN